MRAEIYRPESPDRVVASATWSDEGTSLEVFDDSVSGLDALLRKTPTLVPASFPGQPRDGASTIEPPGSPRWFRAALITRAAPLGLQVRFVEDDIENGWDPAANYRTFRQQERRLIDERDA